MISTAEVLHLAAVFGGASVIAGALARRPNLSDLITRMDFALIEKVVSLENRDDFDASAWCQISRIALLRQARLLVRITVEIARQYPDRLDAIPHQQKRVLRDLQRAAIMSLFCRFGARACAESFQTLFLCTEQTIITADVIQKGAN